MSTPLQLVTPFPPEHYSLLWGWLQQFPASNFDDSGPRTLEEFVASMGRRVLSGQTCYEVVHNGQPVGAIAFTMVGFIHQQAKFCGICFDQAVHGKGIALEAVRMVLREVFSRGAQSAMAVHFSDNIAVQKMFRKLGSYRNARKGTLPIAREVAKVLNPATRGGEQVNLTVVVIDGGVFRANDRSRGDQTHSRASEALPTPA